MAEKPLLPWHVRGVFPYADWDRQLCEANPEDSRYVDGTGQELNYVHKPDACANPEACVIHNPSSHYMREWPTHWSGMMRTMLRICPHDIPHLDPDDLAFLRGAGGREGDVIELEAIFREPCEKCKPEEER